MRLEEILKLNEQLTVCLKSINDLKEELAVAHSNIAYWSSHDDIFDNLGQAMELVPTIEILIELNQEKVKLIINQLNICINQNQ
jgi:hypothetical protein